MQKVSYMGDGSTTEFSFNFPYFENTNIVVTKNNTAATGYNVVGTSAAPDADIPYTGGKVIFENAPTALDCITIARNLPLSRVVDYQPTAKIDPTTLNQDMNYMTEVLKDQKDELDGFHAQYADIVDKESTTNLLAKIAAVSESITTVSAQIAALGDISTLRQSVTTNTNDITSLKSATNFTTTGKSAIANLAMPGTTYDDLTLETSGTTYTAPANGVFSFILNSSGSAWANVSINDNVVAAYNQNSGIYFNGYFCVGSGDVLKIEYVNCTKNRFKFIYANAANQ